MKSVHSRPGLPRVTATGRDLEGLGICGKIKKNLGGGDP
ncbi:hypothetical protein PF003_g32247 [Phytophthora fragariae]|nr:hypothetical protein PF003_g32247 [Phytophthora fragariae]